MQTLNLNGSQFADEINVQRSGISHILAGRNKPSLEFVLKIKYRYPEIRLDWLLLGEGELFHLKDNENQTNDTPITEEEDEIIISKGVTEEASERIAEPLSDKSFKENKAQDTPSVSNETDKVLVLFPDQTFDLFIRRKNH